MFGTGKNFQGHPKNGTSCKHLDRLLLKLKIPFTLAIFCRCLLIISVVISSSCNVYAQDYSAVKQEFIELYEQDKKYRIILDSLTRKAMLDWNHPEIQKLIPAAVKVDSINLRKIEVILTRFGWLGTDKVGKVANERLFLIIQHAEANAMMRFFPLLVKSYEEGTTPGKHYAIMLDRILIEQGKKQVFGTQFQNEREMANWFFFPLRMKRRLIFGERKLD